MTVPKGAEHECTAGPSQKNCRKGIAVVVAKSLQSCPIMCDPMDCSLPGFSVRGILQARILEWGATR